MLTRILLTITTLFVIAGCGNSVVNPAVNSTVEPQTDLVVEASVVDASAIEVMEPLPVEDGQPPASMAIPDLDLEIGISPMGWRIADVDGASTTEWDIPDATAGWHVTSAGPGTAGNMIISGHQVAGKAVFSQIALGGLEEGALIYVADETAQRFVYKVTTIAEPIPLLGATSDDIQAANAFAEPTTSAQLTLITGWPDFSTTHYLFVTAEFVGMINTN